MTVAEPPAVTATATHTDVTCNGGNDGTATVTPGGGTPGYTYSWNTTPVQTGVTATGLTAGTYTVTVTDANNCTETATVTVAEPTQITLVTSSTDATCGASDGGVSVVANGGTAPYSYSWNTTPVQNTDVATNLPSGTYTVTVTDANNCTQTANAIVSTTGAATLTVDHTDVSCNGGNDGTATVTATGAVPPYTYSWNTVPVQTTPTATGLTAGTYTVIVTDDNSCNSNISVTVAEPVVLTVPTSSVAANCGGSDGSATVTPAGGTAPYTYSWNTTPVQTTPTASGIPAGSYTVTVTDDNGCEETATVTVDDIGAATLSTTHVDILCNGANTGSITLTTNGGVPPFTYDWSNGETTQDLSNIPAGTYTVDVTGANGCTATTTVDVIEPTALDLPTTQSEITCFGDNDGTATVTVSGGTPPYSYSWNTTPVQNTDAATGLAVGNYTVTVTDDNGCVETADVTITEPLELTTSANHTDVSCNGGNDGDATVTAVGGTAPYTYSWNTTPIQNTDVASGLTAGNYTVTVTDDNGCISDISVTIDEPTPIVLTTSSVAANCGGADGSATVNASGGVGPYTYTWNTTPVQNTADANGITAGTYIVTVTDANGCTEDATVNVDDIGAAVLGSTHVNILCNGASTGSITLTATGGVPPLSYNWSNGETTQNLSNIPAGSYTVTVTGSNGCVATRTVNVSEPPPIDILLNPANSNCGASDGSITTTVTGGTGVYTYSWNTTPVQNTATASNLPSGTYTLTVTDGNNCVETATASINDIGAPDLIVTSTDVSCFGGNDGTATVTATGGVEPYTYSWNTTPVQTTPTASNLTAGNYIVTVITANGCQATENITITSPDPITLNTSSTDENCDRENGTATVIATGGVPPYTYEWNDPNEQTTNTATGLPGGTYTVIVTDANGCPANASETLDNIPGPTAGFNFADVCVNTPVVFDNTSVNGVSFNWNMGDGTNLTQEGVIHTYTTPGTYSVQLIITDTVGCTDTITRDIVIHPLPVVDFSASPVDGCAPVTTTFTNNNPLPGSSCSWTFGNGATSTECNPVNVYSNPGCYDITLTVTSAEGCVGQQTQNNLVCVTGVPVADFNLNPVKVSDLEPNIDFTNLSTGADSYYWEFNNGNSGTSIEIHPSMNFEGLAPGTYDACLWATNSLGCVDSICKPFIIFEEFFLYVPNAFTPFNGDGVNDVFIPVMSGHSFEDYTFYIFNRWGELIFETSDPTMGWDGTHLGVMSKSDVYVWKLKVKPMESIKFKEYVGHVTLLK